MNNWKKRFEKEFDCNEEHLYLYDPRTKSYTSVGESVKSFIEKELQAESDRIIEMIENIRRFDEKEDGANYFAGWDHAIDLIKSDIRKLKNL